ncbi:HK97 family phage prohead protease [Dielma fastidiosa]|uniref:HK97 family phage prohead protease n=1 Tax=Dielma fastidiosa TaxID=1034346 RepID=UPI0015F852EA|nr:HK97 family phage prohead protease [Dielma fastidiosa]
MKRNLDFEIRSKSGGEGETCIVEGYAAKFNTETVLFEYNSYSRGKVEYREKIDQNAFDECDMKDVVMLYDHEGRVLARTSNNTLTLTIDDVGLKVRADLSGTQLGRDVFAEIRDGYVTKMSFSFTIDEEKNEQATTYDLRTITKVKRLHDVSAVSIPAYDDTSINARSLEEAEKAAASKAEKELKRRRLLIRLS